MTQGSDERRVAQQRNHNRVCAVLCVRNLTRRHLPVFTLLIHFCLFSFAAPPPPTPHTPYRPLPPPPPPLHLPLPEPHPCTDQRTVVVHCGIKVETRHPLNKTFCWRGGKDSKIFSRREGNLLSREVISCRGRHQARGKVSHLPGEGACR